MLLGKATHDILTSKIEGTEIGRLSLKEVHDLYAKFFNLRQNEIDAERARNGQKSRNKIRPRLRVSSPGPVFGVDRGPFGIGGSL